jgi:hypothetical protein
MYFVVSPPGCGQSVTDFWGWDAHEVQLRCPDEVDGDIWMWSTRRGLKPKFYQTTQTKVTMETSPSRKNPHSRTGNRTWDLMISSQKLWPLDHEAGPLTLRNTSLVFTRSVKLILLSLSSTILQNFQGIYDLLSEVSKYQHHKKRCSKCRTSLFSWPEVRSINSVANCYAEKL